KQSCHIAYGIICYHMYKPEEGFWDSFLAQQERTSKWMIWIFAVGTRGKSSSTNNLSSLL
ncbi:hypothetical protein STEG23_024684, partial [Scotinomys teguina]